MIPADCGNPVGKIVSKARLKEARRVKVALELYRAITVAPEKAAKSTMPHSGLHTRSGLKSRASQIVTLPIIRS